MFPAAVHLVVSRLNLLTHQSLLCVAEIIFSGWYNGYKEKSFQYVKANHFTTTMECCILKLSKGITRDHSWLSSCHCFWIGFELIGISLIQISWCVNTFYKVLVGSTASVHLLVAGEPFLCSFFGSTLIVIMILGLFGVSFKGGLFNGDNLSM